MSTAPNILNGLSYQETMRLGMDYMADEETASELARFTGIYIEAIEGIVDKVDAFIDEESAVAKQDDAFKQLCEQFKSPLVVSRAAREAGGIALREMKHSLRDDKYKIFEEGGELGTNLRDYIVDRRPEVNGFWLSGKWYDLDTNTVRLKEGKKVLVFASQPDFEVVAREIYDPREKITAGHPTPKRWRNFAQSLIATTLL